LNLSSYKPFTETSSFALTTDTIAFPSYYEARERTLSLLEKVGIADPILRFANYPFQLSGGMRQRVMIAIAVACNPNIVIADEPTTALDVTIQAQIVELFKQLRESMKMATIWISHDLGLVASLADRVLVLYGGQIVETAKVDDLYEQGMHPYTLGLLGAVPGLDMEEGKRLISIEGTPPDLMIKLTIALSVGVAHTPRNNAGTNARIKSCRGST